MVYPHDEYDREIGLNDVITAEIEILEKEMTEINDLHNIAKKKLKYFRELI
jgi:hypothetical protein